VLPAPVSTITRVGRLAEPGEVVGQATPHLQGHGVPPARAVKRHPTPLADRPASPRCRPCDLPSVRAAATRRRPACPTPRRADAPPARPAPEVALSGPTLRGLRPRPGPA
jgi:hypothetical protein